MSGTNLMMAVGTLIAVFALLSQVGSPQELWDTITSADIWWLIVAMIISLLTNFATAVALMGTVPINLPLIRTAELQLSMSFSNLAVPGDRRHGRADPLPAEAGRRPRLRGRVGRAAHQRRQHRRPGHAARGRGPALADRRSTSNPSTRRSSSRSCSSSILVLVARRSASCSASRSSGRWSCRRPRRRPRRCGRRCARRAASRCCSAATRSTR